VKTPEGKTVYHNTSVNRIRRPGKTQKNVNDEEGSEAPPYPTIETGQTLAY
jgi:hypothetical protein